MGRRRAHATRPTHMCHCLALPLLIGVLAPPPVGPAGPWFGPGPAGRDDGAHVAQTTHALRGVVKSVGVERLVVARSGPTRGDLTFVLTPSTLREGALAAGVVVSVRYLVEGTTLVATAVVARLHPPVHRGGG